MEEAIKLLQEFIDETGHITRYCQFCDRDYWDEDSSGSWDGNSPLHYHDCLITRARHFVEANS